MTRNVTAWRVGNVDVLLTHEQPGKNESEQWDRAAQQARDA